MYCYCIYSTKNKAADELKINYSSAKTIFYLHRKSIRKNSQFSNESNKNRCLFKTITQNENNNNFSSSSKLMDVEIRIGGKINNVHEINVNSPKKEEKNNCLSCDCLINVIKALLT